MLCRSILLAVAWIAVALPCRADVFQTLIDRAVSEEAIPGGVLLVSAPGLRRIAVSGVADRSTGEPVRPDTRFYVASVGKMAVAVTALQLVGEGRLALDAPAGPLASGISGIGRLVNARTARVEQLLNHTSGIPDYLTDDFAEASRKAPSRRWTAGDALPYAFGLKADGRPGDSYSYSNSNFVLLGDIVATAAGAPLETVLERRVLAPAGMTETTVGASPDAPRLAHGYAAAGDEDADEDEDNEDTDEDDGEERDVSLPCWNSVLGDGPLVATAGDLERFLFALFRDGRLLPAAMVRRMVEPSDRESGYGLGLELGEDRWGRWYGHTGSYDGFEAEARYYPEREAVIVYLANGNTSSDADIVDRAATALFRRR